MGKEGTFRAHQTVGRQRQRRRQENLIKINFYSVLHWIFPLNLDFWSQFLLFFAWLWNFFVNFTKIAIIREFLTVHLASKFASSKLIHTWHAQNLKTHALSHRSCMKYLKFLNLHEISLNIAKNSSRLCLWNFYSLFLCVMRSTIFSFIILIFFLPSRSTRERNSHFFQLIFDCWMIDDFFHLPPLPLMKSARWDFCAN